MWPVLFFCSVYAQTFAVCRKRYDPVCMTTVNQSANQISREMHCLAHSGLGFHINWKRGIAVVIDNWMALHGRGASPENEGARVLERIYVRDQ